MTLTVPAGQASSVGRARRAQEKAAANKATIERMNARDRAAHACDSNTPLTTETRTPTNGQEASTTMSTPTMATPSPNADAEKAPRPRSERTAAIAAARARGKRGKGKPISAQDLLDYVVKVRKECPDAKLGTESSYAWWVEGYAFSQARWKELWELAGTGVTKIQTKDAPKPESAPKAAPAKKATKRTPGEKARAAKTATPKASTGRKVTPRFKESAKKS